MRIYRESNLEVPIVDIIEDIKFDEVIREIKECDIQAFRMRIETFELKGFNTTSPVILHSSRENNNDPVKIRSLFNAEEINPIIYQSNITQADTDQLTELKFGKMKYKEATFDQITLASFTINKYGNYNLISLLWAITSRYKGFGKDLFSRFDGEQGEYDIRLYHKGRQKIISTDNRNVRNSPFIKAIEGFFWVYLIEKAIAFIHKHYINVYDLQWSDMIMLLTPAPIIKYSHHLVNRKDLFDILKAQYSTYICFGERDTLTNEIYSRESYLSFYIVNLFKIGSHRYIELFMPIGSNIVSLSSSISDEDKSNKDYFTEAKMKDDRHLFFRFEYYFKYFRTTYISRYIREYYHNTQRLLLNDRNINLLKFRIPPQTPQAGKTKISLSIHLKHPLLYRFILAKITIIEKFIRRIKTMSSNDNDESNQSFYTDEIEYNFEYIDSVYQYDTYGVIEGELEEGTYCLLYNIYTNNPMKVSINSYSNHQIEFLDDNEKISQEQLHTRIKTLFISYINKSKGKTVTIKDFEGDLAGVKTYSSLINQIFGYSLFLIENKTEERGIDKNLSVTLDTEVIGMNLITKDYEKNNSTDIKLIIPPNNIELVVFEWEKSIDEISIYIEPFMTSQAIEPLFTEESFENIPRNYINKTNVYYREIQYRRGVFLVFVNEHNTLCYTIKVLFKDMVNLEYNGIKDWSNGEKGFEFDLGSRSFMSYNLKAKVDMDFSYKILLKIHVSNSHNSMKESHHNSNTSNVEKNVGSSK